MKPTATTATGSPEPPKRRNVTRRPTVYLSREQLSICQFVWQPVQLFRFDLCEKPQYIRRMSSLPTHPTHGLTTIVFDAYWKFAAERQRVYEKRVRGEPQPWTDDHILQQYKFTNPFRAADRVSQYLINEVIYNPDASRDPEEVVFRILLFKLFNHIPAWKILTDKFGMPTWKGFNQHAYVAELNNAKAKDIKLFGGAYIQNQKYAIHLPTKHERYLALLDHMMRTNVTRKLQAAPTYFDAFKVLRSYPLHGRFIAMQHLTDLNYSEVIDFDEDDFIVPGPGALAGIQKCWGILPPSVTPSQIIQMCVSDQDVFLSWVGEPPVRLLGKRRLHAIDCQNLYCETDKYARVSHPTFNIPGGKTQIKQKLKPAGPLPPQLFPPKWGL
jgi:5-hmdU DNA kinase-like protein